MDVANTYCNSSTRCYHPKPQDKSLVMANEMVIMKKLDGKSLETEWRHLAMVMVMVLMRDGIYDMGRVDAYFS